LFVGVAIMVRKVATTRSDEVMGTTEDGKDRGGRCAP